MRAVNAENKAPACPSTSPTTIRWCRAWRLGALMGHGSPFHVNDSTPVVRREIEFARATGRRAAGTNVVVGATRSTHFATVFCECVF